MNIEKYHRWKDEKGLPFVPVPIDGVELLHDPMLNKGTAFSEQEREEFRLKGLLPPHVSTIDQQLDRVYEGFKNSPDDINKYLFLRGLQDRNETLFYCLLERHVEEMTPIIYTPTVGEACRQFSHRFRRSRGLYITKSNIGQMGEMVHHFPSRGVKVIVVTDNQGILGIGDQGVGGMGIPIGKLSLYSLGAGIHPSACLPITLDVGTNNEDCLNDSLYLGERHKRMVGEEYDEFIDRFVKSVKSYFPNAILQWEDFSKNNAFNNLLRYKDFLPSFNDDIQGTGAVCLAGIMAALGHLDRKLKDEVYIIFGAGAGGVGIANQIRDGLIEEGLSEKEALERLFVLDSKGLIMDDRKGLEDYKRTYAKKAEQFLKFGEQKPGRVSLRELLKNQRSTVLIGVSTQPGSFDQGIVEQMCEHSERPLIFPFSNPLTKCEAKPKDIYRWSMGRAIVATGSPYNEVLFEGKKYRIGQGNNVFIFPAVGLSAVIGKFQVIDSTVFYLAAKALSELVPKKDFKQGAVYPRIADLQKVTRVVAQKILECYSRIGEDLPASAEEVQEMIHEQAWNPAYLPYRKV